PRSVPRSRTRRRDGGAAARERGPRPAEPDRRRAADLAAARLRSASAQMAAPHRRADAARLGRERPPHAARACARLSAAHSGREARARSGVRAPAPCRAPARLRRRRESRRMKFFNFHLMPYRHADLEGIERNGSAWVTYSNRHYDPEKGAALYHEYLDQMELADRLGFDGVCLNEHHQTAYGMMPIPGVLAGALARSVKRAKLAILG